MIRYLFPVILMLQAATLCLAEDRIVYVDAAKDDPVYVWDDEQFSNVRINLNLTSVDSGFGESDLGGFGLAFDFSQKDWPLAFSFGYSIDSGETPEENAPYEESVEVLEFSIGVKKFLSKEVVRPYVGIGLCHAEFNYDYSGASNVHISDDGIGLYFDAGIFYYGESVVSGVGLRLTFVDIDMGGLDVDGSSQRIVFSIGGHF